jgi:hypothetical protein
MSTTRYDSNKVQIDARKKSSTILRWLAIACTLASIVAFIYRVTENLIFFLFFALLAWGGSYYQMKEINKLKNTDMQRAKINIDG